MIEENTLEVVEKPSQFAGQSFLKGQNLAKQAQKREQHQFQLRKNNRSQMINSKRCLKIQDRNQNEQSSNKNQNTETIIDQQMLMRFPDGHLMNRFNMIEKLAVYLDIPEYQSQALNCFDQLFSKACETVIDKFMEMNLDEKLIYLLPDEQNCFKISRILINITMQSAYIKRLLYKQLPQVIMWLYSYHDQEVQKNAIWILANLLDEGYEETLQMLNQINLD